MAKSITDQHEYYLYHEENRVYARMGDKPRVLVKEFALDADHGKDIDGLPITANQAAHNFVQSIINPDGVGSHTYGKLGFLHPDFLAQVSPRCEATVKAAYAAAEQQDHSKES